jgi:type VI secretion system protein VasD
MTRASFVLGLLATFAAAAFGGPLALVSCGSAPPPPPKPVPKPCAPLAPVLAIAASDRLNATADGQPRPVQLRIYQLKSDTRLRSSSFEDIWQKEAHALAGDLVKSDEHTIYPGQSTEVDLKPEPGVTTVAAVALFREPQGKDWFVSYELQPPRSEPPCPQGDARIPIWLDRMQIQDGSGRAEEAGSSTPGSAPGSDAVEGPVEGY